MAFIFNDGSGSLLDYNPNDATLSNALAFYRLKELLKTAGWTHEASNDGTNVSNTSGNANDQIGSGSEYNNNHAYWFGSRPAIKSGLGAPGNDIIGIRRHTTSTSWSIIYVPAATDGTKQAKTANGTTTTIPTWATMKAVRGTLPDTAPIAWVMVASATRRYSMGADNAAPYGFWFCGHQASGILNTSSGNGGTFLFFDIVEPDSMQPGDVAPVVITCANDSATGPYWSGSLNTASPADNAGGPVTFMRYGLTGSVWTQCPMLVLRHDTFMPIIPGGAGLSQYSPLDEMGFPILYGVGAGYTNSTARISSNNNGGQPCGIKGRSYMLSWRAAGHPFGLLMKKFTAGDRCVFGDVLVPWDGSTQVTFTS